MVVIEKVLDTWCEFLEAFCHKPLYSIDYLEGMIVLFVITMCLVPIVDVVNGNLIKKGIYRRLFFIIKIILAGTIRFLMGIVVFFAILFVRREKLLKETKMRTHLFFSRRKKHGRRA